MIWYMVSPPAVQCVSEAEAMRHLRLIGEADEDIGLKLSAAIRMVERKCGPVAEQTIHVRWEAAPAGLSLILPCYQASTVLLLSEDGTSVPSSEYSLRGSGGAMIELSRSLAPPIEADIVCGWSAADVPTDIKAAVLYAAAHLHEVRQPVSFRAGGAPQLWPMTIDALCSIYRSWLDLAHLQE